MFPSRFHNRFLQRRGKYLILLSAGVWGASAFFASLHSQHFSPLNLYKLKTERSSIIQDSILNSQFLKLIIKMVPNDMNHYSVWKLLLMACRIHLSDSGLHLSLSLNWNFSVCWIKCHSVGFVCRRWTICAVKAFLLLGLIVVCLDAFFPSTVSTLVSPKYK